MVAHELAHARHRDVLLGTALGALGGVLGVSLLALLLDSAAAPPARGGRGRGGPAPWCALVAALVAVGTLASAARCRTP